MASDDIEELGQLLQLAKRPRVRALLSAQIASLQKEIEDARLVNAPLEKIPVTAPEMRYTTLDSFSWDQDENKVKIYISLEGASSDKILSKFTTESFDVKIHDVAGKHYRTAMTKLNKPIDPEESAVIVKPKRLVVVLKKKDKATWPDLHFKEDKLKANLGEKADPMSGIMDMMKNMYDEGDENIKKAIAQAYSEARSKGGMQFG